MRALITSLIAGAVVLGGAGVVISHHSADANTTAAYTSQKQQRINQGLAQAQKTPPKHTITVAWRTFPLRVLTPSLILRFP